MKMMRMSLILAGAAGALLLPAAGPAARNIKAKPDAAACAQARSRGQTLPGCPRPDNDVLDARSGAGTQPPPAIEPPAAQPDSADDQQEERAPRDGFLVCPGNPRCPK